MSNDLILGSSEGSFDGAIEVAANETVVAKNGKFSVYKFDGDGTIEFPNNYDGFAYVVQDGVGTVTAQAITGGTTTFQDNENPAEATETFTTENVLTPFVGFGTTSTRVYPPAVGTEPFEIDTTDVVEGDNVKFTSDGNGSYKLVRDPKIVTAPPFTVAGVGTAAGTGNHLTTTFTVPYDGNYVLSLGLFQARANSTVRVSHGVGVVAAGDDATNAGDRVWYDYLSRSGTTVGANYDLVTARDNAPQAGVDDPIALQAGVTYEIWKLTNTGLFVSTNQLQMTITHQGSEVATYPEVGTPHNAGSTRHYVAQVQGGQLVQALHLEEWTSGSDKIVVDHFIKSMEISGVRNITSSGTINWSEPFDDETNYAFLPDVREAQAELGVIRPNSRTTTSISYTLHDSVGTGDSGSQVRFLLKGDKT